MCCRMLGKLPDGNEATQKPSSFYGIKEWLGLEEIIQLQCPYYGKAHFSFDLVAKGPIQLGFKYLQG